MTSQRILINKCERKLHFYEDGQLVGSFDIVLGFDPVGHKEVEGDGRTPEGTFYIFVKNPKSSYHLSLGLSYPSTSDAERGLRAGLISQAEHDEIVAAVSRKGMPPQKTRLGGEIYIHGESGDKPTTSGCIRLKNEEIEWLFEKATVGMEVVIRP